MAARASKPERDAISVRTDRIEQTRKEAFLKGDGPRIGDRGNVKQATNSSDESDK